MPFPLSMFAVLMFFVILSVLFGITRLLLRHINIIVPSITYEIGRAATGIVFMAVLAPVFRMTGRYMQVDWLMNNAIRCRMNNDWSRVNDFWLREITDINAAIKAWLTNADRHPDTGIGCLC